MRLLLLLAFLLCLTGCAVTAPTATLEQRAADERAREIAAVDSLRALPPSQLTPQDRARIGNLRANAGRSPDLYAGADTSRVVYPEALPAQITQGDAAKLEEALRTARSANNKANALIGLQLLGLIASVALALSL